jgi:hypothetical protein
LLAKGLHATSGSDSAARNRKRDRGRMEILTI